MFYLRVWIFSSNKQGSKGLVVLIAYVSLSIAYVFNVLENRKCFIYG